ncbi:MAG TPA: GldG family protein [Burkholderiales bacterium]|nr:GldG family protein [Burkholderiales bacterium]
MQAGRRLRIRLTLQGSLFLALFIALVMLLAFIARDYRKEWDVTRTARNTLAQPTLDVLRQLEGPLTVTAFAVAQDAAGGNVHRTIEERLRPYRRAKPDLELKLVDPREDPKRAEEAGIRTPNELVIEYRKRSEHLPLSEFGEQAFANVLMRLIRGSASLVLGLEGHGERKLDGIANHDLGEFGRQLQQKGLKLNSVNLALAQAVPANAAVLVIATPQTDLQPSEVEKIERYLEAGGNLLWLIDPEPLRGLQPIAEKLGLVLTPGTIVDFVKRAPSGPPVFAFATSYGPHPITAAFRYNTMFPYARQIDLSESEEWRITPLIEVAQRGWVEMGKLDEKPTFDSARDLPGPVNIAAAFERAVGDKQQRIVVIGNGAFVSNTYLGNGGNLQLGIAMVNWLTAADELVAIDPRPAADSRIEIDQMTLYLIALAFLLALPVAFVLTGVVVWWRRRKAA